MTNVGFDVVANADARVLILGTLPGVESLAQRQYYANKANSFWFIMGELIGAEPGLSYAERLELLKKHHIALWDVCHSAERDGSLDAKIIFDTIVVNDFKSLFARCKKIELICFNGKKAEQFFRKNVTDIFPELASIPTKTMPSTSPAYANITREKKSELWSAELKPYLRG